MQDSPRNRKPGEEPGHSDVLSASARRRQWQDVLNEQLRALYDTYRTDDIPPDLLDLAARIEEAQQRNRSGEGRPGSEEESSRNGGQEEKAPSSATKDAE